MIDEAGTLLGVAGTVFDDATAKVGAFLDGLSVEEAERRSNRVTRPLVQPRFELDDDSDEESPRPDGLSIIHILGFIGDLPQLVALME